MHTNKLIDREIVRTEKDLRDLCAELEGIGRFALDTEFLAERSYVPQLCLIQVATETFTALIDTVALPNLKPFWSLVQNPAIEKVLHAAREDLRLAYYGGGKVVPCNVFDTQIAAGIVGLPQYPLSYGRLVEGICGERLSKSETRSEWDKRPLTVEQIRYARDDVRFLLSVADKLKSTLSGLDRTSWMDEEMERYYSPATFEPDPEAAFQRVRAPRQGFTRREAAIVRAISAWRERYAEMTNQSVRFILKDETLIELVLRPPQRISDFVRVRGMALGDDVTLGPQILDCINSARRLSDVELPPPIAGSADSEAPSARNVADLLFVLASALCLQNSIAPELAVSRATAAEILIDPETAQILRGWRGREIGRSLLAFVLGESRVDMSVVNRSLALGFTPNSELLDV